MRSSTLVLAAAFALAATPAAFAQDPASKPEPEAVQALTKMSAYLRTLDTFRLKTETSLDLVTVAGERLQFDGGAQYKVRRSGGFVIEVTSDLRKRAYYYDGKQFTIVAPELGYYASVAAPPTNIAMLDQLEQRFGITLPIEDLFRWNAGVAIENLESGYKVGVATIDGVKTDHYAFRQGIADWQVWIQQGPQPLPRKLVIIDRSDLAHPAYVAKLTWTVNPSLKADEFAYRPTDKVKQIRLTALDGGTK